MVCACCVPSYMDEAHHEFVSSGLPLAGGNPDGGTRAQVAANRALIIGEAARQFRQRGFDGIGVAELMRSVGLTHGGFYSYFASKEELMALACRRAVDDMLEDWRGRAAAAPTTRWPRSRPPTSRPRTATTRAAAA